MARGVRRVEEKAIGWRRCNERLARRNEDGIVDDSEDEDEVEDEDAIKPQERTDNTAQEGTKAMPNR